MKKLLFTFFVLINCVVSHAQDLPDSSYNIESLMQSWNHPINKDKKIFDSVDQMLVVFREHYSDIKIAGVEKENGLWELKLAPVRASIGRSGLRMANFKREGDGFTPTGFFGLGQLFSYEPTIPSNLPFTQSTPEDKWIDDTASNDYNKHIRGVTNAKSYENLLLKSIHYKYCMVIEYNTNPVIKGNGSAIFFHVADDKYSATAGCVAIKESDMLQYLNWLQSNKRKAIWIMEDDEEDY